MLGSTRRQAVFPVGSDATRKEKPDLPIVIVIIRFKDMRGQPTQWFEALPDTVKL